MLTIAPTSTMQADYAVALLARYGVTDATGQDRTTKSGEADAARL
jgi:hypothetical protein